MTKAKLTYSVEFTKNMGNFENVKPRYELTQEVEYDSPEQLEALRADLEETVEGWLVERVDALSKKLRQVK